MNDITSKPVAQESFHPLKSCPSKATTASLRQEQMWHNQAKLRESEAKWQEVSAVFISVTKPQA